jgi:hypothetical protein
MAPAPLLVPFFIKGLGVRGKGRLSMEDAKGGREDRGLADAANRRYIWSPGRRDLSWIVRTVRGATGLGSYRFARLVGSNHTSILRCEHRRGALRMRTLEEVRKVALSRKVALGKGLRKDVVTLLDTEILLARTRAEKGGWR